MIAHAGHAQRSDLRVAAGQAEAAFGASRRVLQTCCRLSGWLAVANNPTKRERVTLPWYTPQTMPQLIPSLGRVLYLCTMYSFENRGVLTTQAGTDNGETRKANVGKPRWCWHPCILRRTPPLPCLVQTARLCAEACVSYRLSSGSCADRA